jgi:hypothetical protein
MLRKIMIPLFLILFMAAPALARTGNSTLYGVVTYNGTPLAGALVTIIGETSYTNKSVNTNEKGVYILDNLPTDEYIIRALGQPDGIYKPNEKNVFLWRKKAKEVNFSMEKK